MKALTPQLHEVDAPPSEPAAAPHWHATWGFLGAWIYLVGFVLPLPWELPLFGFALCSMLAIASNSSSRTSGWALLTLAVVAFLGATAVSTVGSVAVGRSFLLSTPLLPAGLLFMVIMMHCAGPRDIRRLYLTLSAVGLVLAVTLLVGVWSVAWSEAGPGNQWRRLHDLLHPLVPRLGIPILIVPNDVTVLAVIAPLSLVLLCRKPRGLISLVPALSILLSVGAVCAYQSRTAVLTMVISLLGTTVLSQRSYRRTLWMAGVPMVLLLGLLTCVDVPQFPGSSLLNKSLESGLSGREGSWANAWAMFLDAPLVGQGPHTYGHFHKKPWPFNLYLEVLAERGLLGLAALGGMLVCGLVGGWQLRRAPTEDGRLLGAGALAGLIGLCSAGMVELTLLREWVVTMLFMLLGVIGHLVSMQLPRGERTNGGYLVTWDSRDGRRASEHIAE